MLKLRDLIDAIDLHDNLVNKSRDMLDEPYSGVSIDSRTVKKGDIFFAVEGKKLDGHKYVDNALAAGAAAAIVNSAYNSDNPRVIKVKYSPLHALHKIANYIRNTYNPLVIAVTGSVGKTTTKNVISSMLTAEGSTVRSEKSFNNEFGVPLTLCQIDQTTRFACIEVGINSPDEMSNLSAIVEPNIAIVTNIGTAHLGRFESQNQIYQEKIKLFDHLKPNGLAMINADDNFLKNLISDGINKKLNIVRVGHDPSCDFSVINRSITTFGQCLTIKIDREDFEISIPLADLGSAYACLTSFAVGVLVGIDKNKIKQSFAEISSNSRMIVKERKDKIIIDDSYNASAASIINGIKMISDKSAEKILVLGDLRELGSHLEDAYASILQECGGVSRVITVGETSAVWDRAAANIGFKKEKLIHKSNWKDATNATKDFKKSTNIVYFVKGSRFSHLERAALALDGDYSDCMKVICDLYIHCLDCSSFKSLNYQNQDGHDNSMLREA